METSLERAWQLYRFRRYPLALEETAKFLGQYPESAEAFCLAALIHGKEKRQKQALEAAAAAIRYSPDWSYPHYVHALIAHWFDNNFVALKSLSEALRLQPNDPDFFELTSIIHADQGHHDTSLMMANQGLRHDPSHVGCLYRRGIGLYNVNKKPEAEEVFRRILAIDPDHSLAQGFIGHFEVQHGRYANGLPLLRNALRDNPEWVLAQTAWKESLRGQYSSYAIVFRIKQLLFGKFLPITALGLAVILWMIYPWIWQEKAEKSSDRGAEVIMVFAAMMTAVYSLLSGYLWLASKWLLITNNELRRTIEIRRSTSKSWKLRFVVIALAIWVFIIMLIIGIYANEASK